MSIEQSSRTEPTELTSDYPVVPIGETISQIIGRDAQEAYLEGVFSALKADGLTIEEINHLICQA